jgi:glycosyltransferase involved in cell wall biosynthesis
MAASLPCVASPVGANTEAVIDGVNGFHAATVQDWESRLETLIISPELRARFGAAGRMHVEQRYSMRAYRSNYAALLANLAGH